MVDELDERTEDLLDHLYRLVYGDDGLGMCGCGWPDEALAVVQELLVAFGWAGSGAWEKRQAVIGRLLPKPPLEHLVLSMLTRADLIEHGSSIVGSWLTARGKWWLWAVAETGGIEGLDRRLDDAGFPQHDGDGDCTKACWQVPDGWVPAGSEPEPAPVAVAAPGVCPGPSCPQYLYGMKHEHTEVQR